MKRAFPLLLAVFLFSACATQTSVISRGYDWADFKSVCVMASPGTPAVLNGIDSIFDKYLISNGLSVIERERINAVLAEQKMSLEGLLKGGQRIDPGVLGADAIMVVQVLFFKPDKKETESMLLTDETRTPFLARSTERLPNGRLVQRTRREERVTYRTRHRNEVVGEYSQISVTARLIDIKNGAVVWVDSDDGRGDTPLQAVENAAATMMGDFARDLRKAGGR